MQKNWKTKINHFGGSPVDGAGKSTTAKLLAEKLNLPIEHHGPVKSLEEGKNEYFNFVNGPKYSVIKDRFAMGEVTYSQIYRNYKADYMKELEEALMEKYDAHLFFITGDADFLQKRLEKRGEDFLQIEDLQHISDLCNEYYEDSILPKTKLFAEVGSEKNCDIILKVLDGRLLHEQITSAIKACLYKIGGQK